MNWMRNVALLCLMGIASSIFAQSDPKLDGDREVTVAKGIQFLKEHGQANDGTFSIQAGPGITALVATAMLRNGVQLQDESLSRSLKALEGYVKPDGGIYGNGRLKNYETCVAVLAFAEANQRAKDGRYQTVLANAKKFLTTMQYGDDPGDSKTDPNYGGAGYAGKGRPDLSNTSYFLEALNSLDANQSDPAIQRAIVFLSRCQNLKSPHNANVMSAEINDGGFFYTVPTEKVVESIDKNSPMGGLRSYGSMTYNGLKSMIYAGLSKDDERVVAAIQWISKHYSLIENPGMGDAGLFYYYHTFGAALHAADIKSLTDSAGASHAWKQELVRHLAQKQNTDGSWRNDNRQWFEDDKNLATAFALLALAYCK